MKKDARILYVPEHAAPDERGLCGVSRRGFMKGAVTAGMGAMVAHWSDLLAAEKLPQLPGSRADQVILLWMSGGPSQMDTWDPHTGHDNGRSCQPIPTAVDGIQIAEHLPKIAKEMKDIALIRSMSTSEGNHDRGTYLMHTGYRPSGTVKHPSMGSQISAEAKVPASFDLPSFMSIRTPSLGAGFLGVDHEPLIVRDPSKPIANMYYHYPKDRFLQRYQLLSRLESRFGKTRGKAEVDAHKKIYHRTVRLVHSKRTERAFDFKREPEKLVNDYTATTMSGRQSVNQFGMGCLLARKLLEAGVRFVEVSLGSWDMHQDVAMNAANLGAQLDQGMGTLIRDLRSKGMLERTLIVWMGEFGRTPKINNNSGRDHWARSWSIAMAGGGVNGGMVVGKTSEDGMDVAEDPHNASDVIATIYKSIGVDWQKTKYSSRGRPMPLVRGGKPIQELVV